jgi:hypothetical protein
MVSNSFDQKQIKSSSYTNLNENGNDEPNHFNPFEKEIREMKLKKSK